MLQTPHLAAQGIRGRRISGSFKALICVILAFLSCCSALPRNYGDSVVHLKSTHAPDASSQLPHSSQASTLMPFVDDSIRLVDMYVSVWARSAPSRAQACRCVFLTTLPKSTAGQMNWFVYLSTMSPQQTSKNGRSKRGLSSCQKTLSPSGKPLHYSAARAWLLNPGGESWQ